MADRKQDAENFADYVLTPSAAFAAVDAWLFPEVQLLPEFVQPFLGWIVGAGLAWIAVCAARQWKAFK